MSDKKPCGACLVEVPPRELLCRECVRTLVQDAEARGVAKALALSERKDGPSVCYYPGATTLRALCVLASHRKELDCGLRCRSAAGPYSLDEAVACMQKGVQTPPA